MNSINLNKISNTYILPIIYYIGLLIVLISWENTEIAPNIIYRSIYLIAFFLPLYLKYLNWTPILLTCFYIISSTGYAYNYFPTELYIYVFILFFGIFLNKKKLKLPFIIIIMIIYISVIDLINNLKIENISYSLIIISFLFYFVDYKKIDIQKKISFSFIIASLLISILLVLNISKFSNNYGYGFERVSWNDENYFSTIVGMGLMCSIVGLFEKNKKKIKLFFILSIILIFISLLFVGSRGALLAISLGTLTILFVSKIKNKYKFLFATFLILFIFLLYNKGFLDFLLFRIKEDDGTGSGRLSIWEVKLNYFINNSNLFHLLTGYGYEKGFLLGFQKGKGFHNDFIAFLVNYGFIGLSLFITFLTYPIRKVNSQNRWKVIVFSIYLISCSLTIEPITAGRLPYFLFYLYILTLSINKEKKSLI